MRSLWLDGRRQKASKLGVELNLAKAALDKHIPICRQMVNGLAAVPEADEPWRAEARSMLQPVMDDLTHAISQTLEVHPESSAGPAHTEILKALGDHEKCIRQYWRSIADVATRLEKGGDDARRAGAGGGARIETPGFKPDGWTKRELVRQAAENTGSFSNSTFDNIRKAAGVKPSPSGGVGQQRRYSCAEVRSLIEAAKKGRFRNGCDIAHAWQELFGDSER